MPPAVVRIVEIVDLEGNQHVREARAGNPDAFELVVQGVLGWAYRLASAILGSEAAAADATQNALVAAWRELPRLRDPDRFDPWFRRILVNECRMQLRRDGRSREVPIPDDPEGIGRLVGASRALAHVEAVDLLERAFERLDPDDRVLIVLHHLDDRPLDEIAEAVHMPLGTVKWRLHEARRALLHALEAME
jgi:RNA polymerase sigma-70 factor (ECF subfamily)